MSQARLVFSVLVVLVLTRLTCLLLLFSSTLQVKVVQKVLGPRSAHGPLVVGLTDTSAPGQCVPVTFDLPLHLIILHQYNEHF